MIRRIALHVVALVSLVNGSNFLTADYPQFRGGDSNAISETALPVTWSDVDGVQKNIAWKLPLEGEGWSQPIVWGDRVFFTAAVPKVSADASGTKPEPLSGGYGRDRYDLMNVVYEYRVECVDARSGDRVWQRAVKTGKPPISRHTTNSYATETPITDGKRVYAYFGMNGVHCLDMDGNIIWQKDLGVYEMRAGWGTASSPTLLGDRLFLQVDNDQQSFLIALDTATGDEVWKVDRDEKSQYSSPFVWQNSQRSELILGGMVYRSYDPDTGKLLWSLDMNKGRSSATPVAIGDTLFVGNEFRNRGGSDDGGGRLYAVTPGGSGDITPANDGQSNEYITWRMDDSGIQMASPTHCGGNLYFLQRRSGILTCVDATTGDIEYERRLRGADAFWASPWSDGRHVFALDSDGNTHVIAKGDELEVVSVNRLDQHTWGTPALSNGRIFLRTAEHLYCIRSTVD